MAYTGTGPDPLLGFFQDGYFEADFECSRVKTHQIVFHFRLEDRFLFKIGQFPSVADLQSVNIRKYRKCVPSNDYIESNKAVGLHAHGIGIGSFVYLRRIFERLIDEARFKAQQKPDWDQELYLKSRMAEKISILREYLPGFLVENKILYGILSKGIHELSEDE